MQIGKRFFETYARGDNPVIVDIGAQDVNGSLRSVAPANANYIGVDFVEGKGVDVIIDDPYKLPLADNSADICVSSSCLEHSEFFWLLFLEMMRILKPTGLLYINAPSNGDFHRYPVDCWRFYPDSGRALQNWGRRNGLQPLLLESFVANQGNYTWNDFVAVLVKDERHAALYPTRMIDGFDAYANGTRDGEEGFRNPRAQSEDQGFWGLKARKRLRRMMGRLTG